MKKFMRFILAIVISFIPCVIGLFFTPTGASDMWYNTLNKSALTPAGWVFAVAWGILYLLLGVALGLVMNNGRTRQNKSKAYALFGVQMVLNALWTYVFFGLHMSGMALIILVVLLFVSVWMMRAFRSISRPAYYMVWPYVIWLVFAMYLNGTIVLLN